MSTIRDDRRRRLEGSRVVPPDPTKTPGVSRACPPLAIQRTERGRALAGCPPSPVRACVLFRR